VFSSPTATIEVVGNTGNTSSKKAGVGGSTPSLATIILKNLAAARKLIVLPKKRIPLLPEWIDFDDLTVYFRARPAYLFHLQRADVYRKGY